jgi:hypothetical protein
VNLDADHVVEIETFRAILDHHPLQHRNAGEEGAHVAHDDTGLATVGCDDHDGRPLARRQVPSHVVKTGDEYADHRQHEGLASATTTHEPALCRWRRRRGVAARALPIDRELIRIHRQREQRGQEGAPGNPVGVVFFEPRCEQVFVAHRLQ